MITKSLSTSRKFAKVSSEFAQVLYVLIVAHSDDFGRQSGDAFTVKHQVFPTSPRTEDEFEAALNDLGDVGLVERYEVDGEVVLQVVGFDEHQSGLHRRTDSRFPKADEPLNASEAQIEESIVDGLNSGDIAIEPFTVRRVERQARIGSLWMDILVTTNEGPKIVIEVKRQKVTDASIKQVLKYCELLGGDTVPVVIGHGLSAGLQTWNCGALLVTYDDRKQFRAVESLNVLEREITFRNSPSEEKRTEEKGTEEKRTARAPIQGSGAFEPGSLPRDHAKHALCGPSMRFCLKVWEYAELFKQFNNPDPKAARAAISGFVAHLETSGVPVGTFKDVESAFRQWLVANGKGPQKITPKPFSIQDVLDKKAKEKAS